MTATINSRITAKIEALLALINHPKTSEDERDAARRALKRLDDRCDLTKDTGSDPRSRHLYNPGAWQGSKYDEASRLSLTEIAKLIRQDLKMARKAGKKNVAPDALAIVDPIADAPAEIKYSVRTEYYAGGGSIDVRITNIPAEWGWTEEQTPEYVHPVKVATPALVALIEEVERIHSAYNYDNSDGMTDYFERHYWGHVSTDYGIHYTRRSSQ